MSLSEKLDKIRSPKLQNQRETAVVLSAVEDTLKDQQYGATPTAYFAALLALLGQSISPSNGIVNKELATSVVYLIDVVIPYVPAPLLRTKFSQILTSIAPVLTNPEIEAPLIKSSIGCLESLLVAQDSPAWALPQGQIGPRRALAGLLTLVSDHRPKVRRRAQDAITAVLKSPPPSPSLDHPAADMCAETAMHNLNDVTTADARKKKKGKIQAHEEPHHPGLIHALQAVKTIAAASGGWPSKKIEPLCQILMNISKSNNEYLTVAAFEVFEIMFEGMADEFSSSKLPRLIEAITELRPSQNDSQLLPPWIAVISRGYDVSAQINPEDTFLKLPDVFQMISGFLTSSSHNIRVSASECLISFLVNCIPNSVITEPSIFDEKNLDKITQLAAALLSAKYQAAWMEVFSVISAIFETLKWRSTVRMNEIVSAVGELRGNGSFQGKKEADSVLGHAVEAMGPNAVLNLLPLNLAKPRPDQPGRAWMLPILRDHVTNTELSHFRSEFVPLSEAMFQRVIEHGGEKTMEIKIFETLIQQVWALLPGYCNLPLDLITAFDQTFAELLANLLYKQIELRSNICKALQMLVESNQQIVSAETLDQDLLFQRRITKEAAQKNVEHLATFTGNILAVLFNVYSETLPQYRGFILQCINVHLSITPEQELLETFTRVTTMLEAALADSTSQTQADKQKQRQFKTDQMPPTTHTLMDLVITISIYLPRSSFGTLFSLSALILPRSADPQLQKKAYKLLPRLAASPIGILALQDRNSELQSLLLSTASTASASCRRDRLDAISVVTQYLPPSSLHFIPSILSEVVISVKEVNEKARAAAFDLLVLMARKMHQGGIISQSKIPHMPTDAPDANASLEEFFTIVSAGLVGSSPHMVSASITALTRILYECHTQLPLAVIEDLVATMDLFLTSASREIVRSVLGFAKVAIITLPEAIIKPRLETLVPGLMSWSREHKAQFRAKIKHIFERMIRRFGFELVDKHCPEDDRKFINNIRKSKDRRKRQKGANGDREDEDAAAAERVKRKSRFESEYDQAIYGSDESDSASDDPDSDTQRGSRGAAGNAKAYIVEDSDEPLDLLDRKALARISSTKPTRTRAGGSTQVATAARTDADGKLIFGPTATDDDDDAMAIDTEHDNPGTGREAGGVGAYVAAIRGRDAVQRGRGGRLKFSNKRSRPGADDDDDNNDNNEDDSKGKPARKNGGKSSARSAGSAGAQGNRVPATRSRIISSSGIDQTYGVSARKSSAGGSGAGRGKRRPPTKTKTKTQTQRKGLGVVGKVRVGKGRG